MPPPSRSQAAIVFGYDAPEYGTSSRSMNEAVAARKNKPFDHVADVNLNKECHVVFGEPGKKRDFSISSTQVDPTGELSRYTAKLNSEAKKFLLQTSLSFGTDAPSYGTSTQLATHYDKAAANQSIARRKEQRKLTGPRPTRGMSYDDEIEYVSEVKSQFLNKTKEFKPSIMAAAVMKDLRATHYTLGDEKLDYSTSSHTRRLSTEEFIKYSRPATPPHDLRKSTVEIS